MRSDVLSRRLFTAGCCGLPWLWAVHVLYHWKGGCGAEDNDDGFINPDDHFADDAMAELSPEEIQMEVQKWVGRCKVGAITGFTLFTAWIVTAQVLRGSVFPSSWYMLNPDDPTMTGW